MKRDERRWMNERGSAEKNPVSIEFNIPIVFPPAIRDSKTKENDEAIIVTSITKQIQNSAYTQTQISVQNPYTLSFRHNFSSLRFIGQKSITISFVLFGWSFVVVAILADYDLTMTIYIDQKKPNTLILQINWWSPFFSSSKLQCIPTAIWILKLVYILCT